MAIENKKGKITPIAASSATSFVRTSISLSHIVAMPMMAAPMISNGDDRSCVTENANTMPKRIVCVMESATIDMLRNTKNAPGSVHVIATITAIICIST